ncbi:MAG: hypothetical protein DMG53_06380 [Acidobacteria bacterium]|nr:MAG: hypothetical protein DMG53_06380 [Acidobacteriota bacterium]PYU68863.1 MAG: hypothetical protein DMG52_30315 [Acidobacteriota bacterium]
MTDTRTQNIVDECKRQEESCLYTSTSLLEWLKRLRVWKALFIITPIILGGVATWPLLAHHDEYKWFTGVCALLAGFSPALYKALDFDVSLKVIAQHAHEFKILQDRFRQAWRIAALGPFPEFKKEFDDLMARMDAARAASLTPPERFFKKAKAKIGGGHYDFGVDAKGSRQQIT